MKAITYVESVLTLASCKANYDEMTKEEFAKECISIIAADQTEIFKGIKNAS